MSNHMIETYYILAEKEQRGETLNAWETYQLTTLERMMETRKEEGTK